jgi:pimeloyl-ACP methyl ester carboxylesterase
MPLKMLLTSKTIWRVALLSAVGVLLASKYVLRHPSAETAAMAPGPSAPTVVLGPSQLPFSPCWLEGSREQVLCGSYQVYENRRSHSGRQIDLRIAVLPALKNHPAPDALFVLAGGPGQAATASGPFVDVALKKLQQDRDIVLIDQRGTGKSNPLNCQPSPDASLPFTAVPRSSSESAQACLAKLDGDPRAYSTFDFAADLDDIRQALGYSQIDIWGGSYGTRAALVYMKTHRDRVRAAVLDGVAPYANKIPLHEARDAQRALDMVFVACDQDEECHSAFPDVRQNFFTVLATLDKIPAHARIRNPHTGASADIVVNKANFATAVRALLYVPSFEALIPLVIRDASEGNFEPLVAVAQEISRSANQDMSRGLMLSVLCSEDVSRIDPQEVDTLTRGTFLGDVMVTSIKDACSHWPRTFLPPGFDAPVDAAVPVLMLSGERDPVTPPEWATLTGLHLSNSVQVVVAGAAHGVSTYGCVPDLIARFVSAGTGSGLDTSCAAKGIRTPFVTSRTGTTP